MKKISISITDIHYVYKSILGYKSSPFTFWGGEKTTKEQSNVTKCF